MRSPKPLILFIDAYDSFSNNIVSLLEIELDVSVRTIKIDDPAFVSDDALHAELSHYAAVVCGPGPGHPEKEEDVGIIRRIWKLRDAQLLPVLGICLGFQSLCLGFGATVGRLRGPQHGIIRRVVHAGEGRGEGDIFQGVGEVQATLYQSLCVDVGQDEVKDEVWEEAKWKTTARCPELLPLAWVESDGAKNDSGVMDNRVFVAARHIKKPFWALQYHPESICTNEESKKVIRNWFEEAQAWNAVSRKWSPNTHVLVQGKVSTKESLLERAVNSGNKLKSANPNASPSPVLSYGLDFEYHCQTIRLPHYISVPEIVESIQDTGDEQIILESSNAHETAADVRGRYSVIGLDIQDALKFEYRTKSDTVYAISSSDPCFKSKINLGSYRNIWSFLAKFLADRKIADGNTDSAFWGGFMGYTTYELGLETIEVESKARANSTSTSPDLCFAWVTRSLVIDHVKGQIYVQHLAPEGSSLAWMDTITDKVQALFHPPASYLSTFLSASHPALNSSANSSTISLSTHSSLPPTSSRNSIHVPDHPKAVATITPPTNASYESKVLLCQSHIRAGDSYELCLTDQTTVLAPTSDSWSLYLTLRARQPAPFASYIHLGNTTLISASPERFLTYSATGKCSLRPMKGTVRKTPQISTLADAIPLLDIPKEKAENLMIVDLVRHDLHSVCGAGAVQVPRLMVVEEYRSVFQMISVVEGQLPRGEQYTGLDVLAASLPPGSMTGAPKKRSCEILQEVESGERGLYSGVVGYMDVGGRGDWSVSIRCMFRNGEEEPWRIGAGGAVTALSTAVGEREEMLTKLSGTLGVFG